MVFNTLQYAKKLEEVGIPRNQAEAHVQIMAEIVEGDLATKQDLKNLEVNLKHEIKDVKANLQQEIRDVETNLKQEIKDVETNLKQEIKDVKEDMVKLEYRLVIKLGAIVVTTTTLAMALTTWLMKVH